MGLIEERKVFVGKEELGLGLRLAVFVDGAVGISGAIIESVGENLNGVRQVAELIKIAFGDVGREVVTSEVVKGVVGKGVEIVF